MTADPKAMKQNRDHLLADLRDIIADYRSQVRSPRRDSLWLQDLIWRIEAEPEGRWEQVGWVLHVEADGGNDVFWWADRFPQRPADGAVPVWRRVEAEGR